MSFLADTHAHLADIKIKPNLEKIIDECLNGGVNKIISIGCSLNEARESIAISEKYRGIVYATAGLYPHDNETGEEQELSIDDRLNQLRDLVKNDSVVAVGECGLDYTNTPPHERPRSQKDQEYLFLEQIKIASQINKPVIIHSRNAIEDTLNLLAEAKKTYDFDAVWHCFTENYQTASKALDMGIMISFTGIITYPKAVDLRETVKKIPMEFVMTETDSPYLVPDAARKAGIKINDPHYVKMVAQEIAAIRGPEYDKIIDITYKNACRFFRL